MEEYKLTSSQKEALDRLRDGENLFISGAAGVGKSFLIDKFVSASRKAGKNVMVVAPTGVAALNVGGYTIHRAIGGPTKKLFQVPKPKKELKEADILIIDEISMVRIDLFDKVIKDVHRSNTIRAEKKKPAIQVVVCGDFHQLPPVVPKNEMEILKNLFPEASKNYYAFEHKDWNFPLVELKEIVRQENPEFAESLNKIRKGYVQGIKYINQNCRSTGFEKMTIQILSKNAQVDEINSEEVHKLGKIRKYHAESYGTVNKGDKRAPDELELAVGARVISLINGQDDYANGSQGTVIETRYKSVIVEFDNGTTAEIEPYEWKIIEPELVEGEKGLEIKDKTIGSYTQLPLTLGYAATIHKSQGQTYSRMIADPSNFAPGQLYVQLSRVTDVNNLYLTEPRRKAPGFSHGDIWRFF